jgi:cysteine desulfurase/selenocysteine lyase
MADLATTTGGTAAKTHGLDPRLIRADFPILATTNRFGKPLIYLDSAATSQKPLTVIEAVDAYNSEYTSNIHRGIYELAERATTAYEAARAMTARLINAPDSHEIVFVRNATEAINLVAYSWGRRNIGRGDTIVLTEMEHHANLVPWQLLVQEKDGDLEFVPITDDGILRLEVFEVLLHLRPKLVAFTHVSNMLGTINPVREMTEMAHAAGALVLIDGAQAVPHLPVDVQEIGADFYVFSGHKMLAPTGSGALWARRELLEAMPPFLSGGDMIREVHLRRSEWNEIPWKFEAGTPDIAAQIGMGAAAEYLLGLGMDAVRAHELEITRYAMEVLGGVPGLELYGPAAEMRGGVV